MTVTFEIAEDKLLRPTHAALMDVAARLEAAVMRRLYSAGALNGFTVVPLAFMSVGAREAVWLLPIVGPQDTWVPRDVIYRRDRSSVLRGVFEACDALVDPDDVRGDLRGTLVISTDKNVEIDKYRSVVKVMLTDASQDTAVGSLVVRVDGDTTYLDLTMRGKTVTRTFPMHGPMDLAYKINEGIVHAIATIWKFRDREHPPYIGALVQHKIDPTAEPYLWIWRPLTQTIHWIGAWESRFLRHVTDWFGTVGGILVSALFISSPLVIPLILQGLVWLVVRKPLPSMGTLADAARGGALAERLVTITDLPPDVWSVEFLVVPERKTGIYLDVIMRNKDGSKLVESQMEISGDRLVRYDVGNVDVLMDDEAGDLLTNVTHALTQMWEPPAWALPGYVSTDDEPTTEETEPTYE